MANIKQHKLHNFARFLFSSLKKCFLLYAGPVVASKGEP